MFANRFTALVDACSLVGVLGRNTLLSLSAAGLYRVRWSDEILAETERALGRMFETRGKDDPLALARRQVEAIRRAFPSALVKDYAAFSSVNGRLPDPDDAHVIAAARCCHASVIVTENLKDFPNELLAGLDIEAKSADTFIADAIDLDTSLALSALAAMRARLDRPEMTAEALLLGYERHGFVQTADLLRRHLAHL